MWQHPLSACLPRRCRERQEHFFWFRLRCADGLGAFVLRHAVHGRVVGVTAGDTQAARVRVLPRLRKGPVIQDGELDYHKRPRRGGKTSRTLACHIHVRQREGLCLQLDET
jgi:hypothetical protein